MANNTLAYGFLDLATQMADRVSTVGQQVVWNAVRESAAEWSRQINALMAGFAQRTTMNMERVQLPGAGTLQPLDESGKPRPVTEAGHFDVGYPIMGGGTAWGNNRVTRAMMTVEEANRYTVEATNRDADWMRRHLLAAILDNVAWIFTDSLVGALTVRPLALSSETTVLYPLIGTAPAADQHYLAQAAAIADATNPYPTIYDELMEHPSNSEPIVSYISSSLVATTKALSNFIAVSDPDVNQAMTSATLPNPINRGLGDLVLGKVDRVWIIEWRALPAGYIVSHSQAAGPFVAMREYDAPALQGYFMETDSDGASQETRMIRYAGFGIRNRIAACVTYVGAGAYAIPVGFDAPQIV